MATSLRSILVGAKDIEYQPSLVLVLGLGVFVGTFAAYALGLFVVSGGIVWIPVHAAVIGMIAGCWVGYARRGLLFAWILSYTSLLGYRADHAVSALSGLSDQFSYFVRLDGLVFLAVEAIILGALAFILGALIRRGINAVHRDATLSSASSE